VKAHHRRALMEEIGRTNRSVEFTTGRPFNS
jgi:hypothetical protein